MNDQLPAIVLDSEGFTFDDTRSVRVDWSSVECIKVFKVDLLTTDEIRLSLHLDNFGQTVAVSEEQPGFEALRTFIEKHFSFPEGWWASALRPAFARNEAVLYKRAQQGAQNRRADDSAQLS